MKVDSRRVCRDLSTFINLYQPSSTKKLQTYKPDSVFRLLGTSAIYLMLAVTRSICAAYPPCCPPDCSGEQCASNAWNKVYMAFQPARFIPFPNCFERACALTARFHLYPPKPWRRRDCRQRPSSNGQLFSATLSMPFPTSRKELHRLGGAALYVVRTFLPASD